MSLKLWTIKETDDQKVLSLASKLAVKRIVAMVLVSRGFDSKSTAQDFLSAEYKVQDPFIMADMGKAVERISRAVEDKQKIEIFGDYDVDGITSTVVLYEYLKKIGGKVSCSLPTREGDGYGLNTCHIDRMKQNGISLIITVDNGVSAHQAVDYANQLGIDTVVCDHHVVPSTLPNAYAVVDPQRPDDKTRFKELAGVGVVLKLITALEGCSFEETVNMYGAFAALGTISDVMPLILENRYIVKKGLESLRESENFGIKALCNSVSIPIKSIDSRTVAFQIAPRINAAGRMGSADTAFRLLTAKDMQTATQLAQELEEMNVKRQLSEKEMMECITKDISENPAILKEPILIFSSENYSAGISGIVCSRLTEKYSKPTIILSLTSDIAKGSGRSVGSFSLYSAIKNGEDFLERFGGHDYAAGFTMRRENVEAFVSAVLNYCKTDTMPAPFSEQKIDAVVEFEDIGETAVKQLLLLSPFGSKNEEPTFATLNAVVCEITAIGKRHSRITLKKNDRILTGAFFGLTPDKLPFTVGDRVDASYNLSIYSSNKGDTVSVKFNGFRCPESSEQSFNSLLRYYSFKCGCKNSEIDKEMFTPIREDISVVYRGIRQNPVLFGDYQALSFRFKELSLGKVAASIDILSELSLFLCTENESGENVVKATENPAKKDLSESEVYRKINE